MSVRRAGWVRSRWAASALREVLPIYLGVRIILVLWVFLVRQVFSEPLPPDPVARPYLGVAVETNPWLEPWQRWDTLHYQAIAERGYTAFDSALFVPPLYPGLVRGASALLGGHSLLAALIVSNLAALIGTATFFSLARKEVRDSDWARRAVLYLSIFPTAFFWVAGYTESLALLFYTVTLLAVRQARWLSSGAAAGLAALTRLDGALLIVPVGVSAWFAARRERSWRPTLAVACALVGAVAFPAYVWLAMGLSPLAPIAAQVSRFQGGFALPGLNLLLGLRRVLEGGSTFAEWFDLAFVLLFLALLVPVWRRLSRPLSLFYSTFLLLLLCRIAGITPLLGSARYVLLLFPAYLILAEWGARPWINRLIVYLSATGLLLLSGQFAIWGWIG